MHSRGTFYSADDAETIDAHVMRIMSALATKREAKSEKLGVRAV